MDNKNDTATAQAQQQAQREAHIEAQAEAPISSPLLHQEWTPRPSNVDLAPRHLSFVLLDYVREHFDVKGAYSQQTRMELRANEEGIRELYAFLLNAIVTYDAHRMEELRGYREKELRERMMMMTPLKSIVGADRYPCYACGQYGPHVCRPAATSGHTPPLK